MTPSEKLEEIEACLASYGCQYGDGGPCGCAVCRPLALVRELREGAVEGWVAKQGTVHVLTSVPRNDRQRPSLLITGDAET